MNRNVAISLPAILALGLVTTFGVGRHWPRADQDAEAKPELPRAMVSSITVEPKEIHPTPKRKGPAAVITVQINHLALKTPQTVSLEVANFSSKPAMGLSVTYNPGIQTVTIPAGPGGVVVATANVDSADIGTNAEATVVIAASLSHPSSGIRIAPSYSDEDYLATLTIKKR